MKLSMQNSPKSKVSRSPPNNRDSNAKRKIMLNEAFGNENLSRDLVANETSQPFMALQSKRKPLSRGKALAA